MSKKTLIKHARILINHKDGILSEGSLVIEGNKIKKVLEKDDKTTEDEYRYSYDEIIDATGMLVVPGMINSHYHSYSNFLKGTVNNLPLEPWALYTVAYGHSFDKEDIELAVLLGALEMIRHGVTGCVDHFPHTKYAQSALAAYQQSGMRVSFAPMLQDITDEQFFNLSSYENNKDSSQIKGSDYYESLYEELIDEWHNKEERLQIIIGPNAPQRCSESLLSLSRRLSERYDLQIHMHLLETYAQQQQIKQRYKESIIHYLDRLGLLSSRLSVAHAVWLDESEIKLLKDNNVSIVHNPASNLMLGSGVAPINKYLEHGINVALGTDATNCGSIHNLFETMRLTAMIHRPTNLNYNTWIDESDVFNMATKAGSDIFGLSNKLGSIEAGQMADIVLLETSNTTWTPMNNVLSQLIFQETGSSVSSVMINGEWVMKDKEILAFNEDDLLQQVKERRRKWMNASKEKINSARLQESYFVNEWRKHNHVGV